MVITALSDERLLAAAKSLPVTPQIMARLHQMLTDANSGLAEIAGLLKRDLALASRIIRIANSPAYNGGGLGSIEEALQRVGFGEVFKLVGVAANADLASMNLRCYGYAAAVFRNHNLCTALVAEGVARDTGMDTRLAYTVGLLRGIGRLLLDRVGGTMLAPHEMLPEAGAGRVVDWERGAFGVTHFEVGARLLAQWGFPDAVVKAVGHDPESRSPLPLARNMAITEEIVRFAGYGLERGNAAGGIAHESLVEAGLSFEDAKRIRDEALVALKTLEQF